MPAGMYAPTRTVTRVVPYGVAPYIVHKLLSHSMWFAFTPLPDDMAEFTVKVEDKAWLEGLVMDVTTADKCPNDSQLASKAVRKFLDLSTGCLPHEEFQALQDASFPCVIVSHAYGLWVQVVSRDNDPDLLGVATNFPHLARVMEVARAHDCAWINFDQDAAAIEELPYWEW